MKKRIQLSAVVAILLSQIIPAQAQTFNSVTHIHSVKTFGERILMGTHEGLFEFISQNNMSPIGKDPFDVMGLDADGTSLFASGHPSKVSKLPNPLGLLRSTDGGKTWKSISLLGQVDFHSLEVSGNQIYGGNATEGLLMYSKNLGKSWKKLGAKEFSDIAILSSTPGKAIALQSGKLLKTNDTFKVTTELKFKFPVSAVESIGKELYIAAQDKVYRSPDQGSSWKLFKSFKGEIADISASSKLLAVVVGGEVFTAKLTK
ncbi:MAG: hypothetical protein RL733_810 [Actinomycetota bacterium]|jgi:photosystem II stability/assembly factor-like uncharacterized protein